MGLEDVQVECALESKVVGHVTLQEEKERKRLRMKS